MYKVNYAQYLASAAWKTQWPTHELPEICLAGRSNVGKSSFINTITNHSKLAKVSSTPGKTRTLNFFDINHELCLVDVPGYGYAKVNDKIKESFGDMIDTYLRERHLLKGLVLIVDYRHKPTRDDIEMYEYAKYYEIPVIVVATKEDKLKRNDLKKNEKLIKETLNFDKNDQFVRFSSLNKVGIEDVWGKILHLCSQESVNNQEEV